MLHFISFGSGSSGNCYYLFTEKANILIDAGVGIRSLKKHFRDYGLNIQSVENILITHDHADHVKSVGSLSHDMNLPVYTTRKVHNGIDRNYCVQHKISADLRKYITPGDTFEIGDISITPFTVPHDSTDNVGYRLEHEGVVFCLMTDVGHVTDEMAQYISEANYLVLESNHEIEKLMSGPYPVHLKRRVTSDIGHLSNKDCGEALANHASPKLRHVWLCHLSDVNNHPVLARKTVETVLRSYGIAPGTDFILDVLKRRTPSDIFELK